RKLARGPDDNLESANSRSSAAKATAPRRLTPASEAIASPVDHFHSRTAPPSGWVVARSLPSREKATDATAKTALSATVLNWIFLVAISHTQTPASTSATAKARPSGENPR